MSISLSAVGLLSFYLRGLYRRFIIKFNDYWVKSFRSCYLCSHESYKLWNGNSIKRNQTDGEFTSR